MPDIAISYAITRGELGLADLALQDLANGYEVIEFGPGSRSWRKETVKSAYVHGETLVSAVMDVQVAPLKMRVRGSTHAIADSRLKTVLDAFSQFVYSIGVVIDGVTWIWTCQPADISVGESGDINKFQWMAKMFEVTASIPRNPVPLSGSL